jgi:hypothetical protein
MLFKALREAHRALSGQREQVEADHPLELERALWQLHERAPVREHLARLFHDVRIGGERYSDVYFRCLDETGTVVTPFTVFQRFQTRLDLVQYFLASLSIPGARAECGVYRGATCLLLCHAARAQDPAFAGDDFYMIDSFSGTSASVEQDHIAVRAEDGSTRMEPFFPAGKTDTTPELVRGYFSEFPRASVCPGWIPEVFSTLPEREWAFVHLDLSLFEPTLASLEYFVPRLSPGGTILCDTSPFCPGVEKAWVQFCERNKLAYVVLGHRVFALLRPS